MDRSVVTRGVAWGAIAAVAAFAACARPAAEKIVASSTVDSTEVVLLAPGGVVTTREQSVAVTIHTGAARAPLAADTVIVVLSQPGPPRAATEARLPRTGAGRFAGRMHVPSAGEWYGDVIFSGLAGTASIRLRPAIVVK